MPTHAIPIPKPVPKNSGISQRRWALAGENRFFSVPVVFSTTSGSSDLNSAKLYLATNAAQHGMIWVNVGDLQSFLFGKDDGINRLGGFLGVMGQSPLDMSGKEAVLDPGDRLTSERFGYRIAEATKRWIK